MSEYIVEVPDKPAKVVCDGWNVRIEWDFKQREEIVRCRDCAKWSSFDTKDGKRIGDCSEWTHLDGFSHATDEDGFCAWGERK